MLIKEGDLVRIKSYEQLRLEFGEPDEYGGIKLSNNVFVTRMRHLSGSMFIVGKEEVNNLKKVDAILTRLEGWAITEDMIEVATRGAGGYDYVFNEESNDKNNEEAEDGLSIISTDDDDMELFIGSNYGDHFNSTRIIKKLKEDIDEEVFYFEIKDKSGTSSSSQVMGMNIKQVKIICDYLNEVVEKLESVAICYS